MPSIRLLPQNIVNRIAAGEVLERPSSAVKELVENAIDAGANDLQIKIESGGKNLISILDNGCGMDKAELALAVQRHATSKIPDDDLFNIKFFGFRGEALPSIGSVARLTITSKKLDAWKIEVNGGEYQEPEPASLHQQGTKVEVRDLFFATPARLKFLKTDESEKNACLDLIKKIAMANCAVSFNVEVDGKSKLRYNKGELQTRIAEILGSDFVQNSVEVNNEKTDAKITGFVGLPTFNRRTSEDQYVYVNGRPVKDKLISGAIKAAYADFLGGGRFPVLVLFIEVNAEDVDVNVHPAKAEVRFKDSRAISGLVISSIRHALESAGHRASTTIADFAVHALSKSVSQPTRSNYSAEYQRTYYGSPAPAAANKSFSFQEEVAAFIPEPQKAEEFTPQELPEKPLGYAKCQLHGTYIVAETTNSIVIVDQHAAHERLVYENYKSQIETNNIKKQPLLIPSIIKLDEKRAHIILDMQDKLRAYGFEIEKFGLSEIVVSQIPTLLAGYDFSQLFSNIADDIIENGEDLSLTQAFEHVLETAACHNSIRAGRKLGVQEMNELLRQMEATPHSGQCNHGRPTYVELKLGDIEKLFGRKG